MDGQNKRKGQGVAGMLSGKHCHVRDGYGREQGKERTSAPSRGLINVAYRPLLPFLPLRLSLSSSSIVSLHKDTPIPSSSLPRSRAHIPSVIPLLRPRLWSYSSCGRMLLRSPSFSPALYPTPRRSPSPSASVRMSPLTKRDPARHHSSVLSSPRRPALTTLMWI